MKQIDIENQLREVVARLMTEVDLATQQGRLDVNLVSEDAWIPILKEVYQCPNLVNLNRKQRNFPGIDLGDEQDRVAFQVSATTDLEKIKLTLEQFKKRSYKNSFDEIFIFTLRKKQKSYSQEAIDKILEGDILFDVAKHIVDPGDILAAITGLRLPAQERLLQEFRTILGDVEATIAGLSAPENVPYVLVSNLLKIEIPKIVYVAELVLDEAAIIEGAREQLAFKKQRADRTLLVKLGLLLSGSDIDGWAVHENRIFSFYDMEKNAAFKSVIDIGSIDELTVEDLTLHDFSEYQNLFKYLLRVTVRDQFKEVHVTWHRDQKEFYFQPESKDDQSRRIEWIGKKIAKRTVYEKKYQIKDPSKIAFHRHLSFDLSFQDIGGAWYAVITPSWLFSWNGHFVSRFHNDLLSKQKRLEHNHSVRNLVRFIAYFLGHTGTDADTIRFGALEEFECLSQISLDEDEQAADDSDEDVENAA
jgi:hypothetical protein